MPAKTNTDKAYDAIDKALSTRDVNYSHIAAKLWTGEDWKNEQMYTLFYAWLQIAEVHERHPLPFRSPEHKSLVSRMARVFYSLRG